jgi:DNA-binding NarL/FixJ family response regulator
VKPKLSEREVEVLDCLIRGWTCREIAKELRLAPRTVKHYLKNAALKMDIKTEWMHIGSGSGVVLQSEPGKEK